MSALDKDKPIFFKTKRPLIYIKNGVVDDREYQMMAVRWNTIYFNNGIPQHQQRNVAAKGPMLYQPPCQRTRKRIPK